MRQEALDQIAPLLAVLRANPALIEVRPTMFHLDGRDFVHFHDYSDGVQADVRLSNRTVRMPVTSAEEQAELLGQIDECLESLGDRARERGRRGGRGQR